MNLPGIETAPGRTPAGGRPQKASVANRAEIGKELLKHVPPHSPEAEIAVLAGLLLRSQLMNSIADILSPEDFYLPAHQLIFKAFLDLYANSAPITLMSTAEWLRERQELENVGGSVYLGQISQAVVSGANAEYYAGIVRDKAMVRTLIDSCANIISNCFNSPHEVDRLLDESEQSIFAVARRTTKKEFVKSSELLEKVLEDLSRLADSKDVITGVTTGFEQLDLLTSGLQNSDLVIVAARPTMGKTAFALCVALNAAINQNVPVGVFSLEMSKEQIMQRMLSVRSKVNLGRLRKPSKLTDDDWENLHQAADVIAHAPIFIDDSSGLSTMELRARARRLKAEHGLGLVVIDYLQLMRSSRRTDSRELEISDISRSLKGLAKELNIPVMALAQLNRKAEERTDKRPILADLRESGAIEQDADVIMFIYRDDVYKYKKPSERPPIGDAEIIIGKQRNGPVGVAELMYASPYTSFESRSHDYTPPAE